MAMRAEPQPCRQCEYDLTGLPTTGRCPECGASYNMRSGEGIAATSDHRRADRFMARLRTIMLFGAVLVVMSCGGLLSWLVHLAHGNWLKPLATAGLVSTIVLMAALLSYLNERDV